MWNERHEGACQHGGLNLSELDGWWAEAYTPEVGWALGDGQEHDEDLAWDVVEAEELFSLLEQEVMLEFYARDERGIPMARVARMRGNIARLTPQFSADRLVREYTEHIISRLRIASALPIRVQTASK